MGFLPTLAYIEEAENHLPTAEALLRECVDIVTTNLGYDNATQLEAVDALARILRRTGRTVEADGMAARAAEIRRKSGQTVSTPVIFMTPSSR